MQKRALIFGASGQAGQYLRTLLLSKGYDVWGTYHNNREYVYSGTNMTSCDVTNAASVSTLIDAINPDEIYNLASLMYAPNSWNSPREYNAVNYLAVVNMLATIYRHCPKVKFFQAGSAEALDLRKAPQSETTPLRPRNPYGVAKAAAQEMVRVYREQKGLYACTGILFNMESPLRAPSFFCNKVVTEVVRIKNAIANGETPKPLVLGKLHAIRDWGYTKEYVEAMYLMLQATIPDDYVIASSYPGSCLNFVEAAFAVVGIVGTEDILQYEKSTIEDLKVPDKIIGDASKIHNCLDWVAKTRGLDLIKLLVDEEITKRAAYAERKRSEVFS